MIRLFRIGLALWVSMTTLTGYAQNARLLVKVIDGEDRAVQSVTLKLEGAAQGTGLTDAEGSFIFTRLIPGAYRLQLSCVGFEPAVLELSLEEEESKTVYRMKASAQLLDEVAVMGELQKKKLDPVKAEIINIAARENRATNLTDLMNNAVGIRIRQTGGLGSNTAIQLNGFQGKSIRMFRDGIPLDYLGGIMGASSLNTIPTGMLSSVEVYKGILPGHLSADALGGAVNLVPKKLDRPSLSISYEAGAFATHRATLNGYYQKPGAHFYAGGDAYFNSARNNYHVMADVADPETANISRQKVRLFHNGYRSHFVEVYGGIRDVKWADDFRVTLASFGMHRDVQFGARMAAPYGGIVTRSEGRVIPSLRYRKSLGRLKLDQFVVWSRYQVANTDTLRGRYDWYSRFTPYQDHRIGEASATLSDVTFRYVISRTALVYTVNATNTLALNTAYTDYRNVGTDPYGELTTGENRVPLVSLPSSLKKLASTLSWSAQWSEKWENVLQVKLHSGYSESARLSESGAYIGELYRQNRFVYGAAEALKYKISARTFLRGSVERAIRMPDPEELFGDGSKFTLPNPNLKPEVSYNFNLGFSHRWPRGASFEANGFFRRSRDMIYSAPTTNNPLYSQSQNVSAVGGWGLELEGTYPVTRWLNLFGNATYQSFRKTELNENEATQAHLLHARIGNIPYAFANLGANAALTDLILKGDRFQAYWNFSYVHMYYYRSVPKEAEPDGFLGLWGKPGVDMTGIIPSYGIHQAGVTWNLPEAVPLSIGVGFRNLFNKVYYDNFRVQNPGRSWSVKLIYYFN